MTDKQPEALRLAELTNFLSYNPTTGIFLWEVKRGQRIKPGDVAGTTDNHGYINIMVDRKMYKAHRLAWFFTYEEIPSGQIDHINGNRSDNRISNLRVVSNKQNAENTGVRADNTSGYRGVSFNKKSGEYEAYITNNQKKKSLGFFKTAEEAAAKSKQARDETFTHADRNLESEIKRLHEVNAELVEALKNAAEEIESWGAYASPYFQNKHDLAGSVAAVHAVIDKATGEQQ